MTNLTNDIIVGARQFIMNNKTHRVWENLLNPDVLRPLLIASSIYITGFEMLKDSIIDRTKDFFSFVHRFDRSGNIADGKYQTDVLSRNKSILYASLDWLKDMKAIDEHDMEIFNRSKDVRNELSHNLHHRISSEGLPKDFSQSFKDMVSLYRKIEVWWVVNFEIPTNPDLDGKEFNENGIMPGTVMFLQLMCEIALGTERKSKSYYRILKNNFGD